MLDSFLLPIPECSETVQAVGYSSQPSSPKNPSSPLMLLVISGGDLGGPRKQILLIVSSAKRLLIELQIYTHNAFKVPTHATVILFSHKLLAPDPVFGSAPAINDVALLILVSPFNLEDAPHIGVACLSPRVPSPATNCYSMGWGKDFQQKN
ncbi:hypothetical protein RR48_00896 [Papilio machaon]|uniref:Peptidase S1 domain-containing protein n=1 Tax=Papilio machaon TaxID=76193 RepID=A0A0N0PBS3_PAPMA|nr:hypothetical protein RR48_00896 [Papilio machaon]